MQALYARLPELGSPYGKDCNESLVADLRSLDEFIQGHEGHVKKPVERVSENSSGRVDLAKVRTTRV
jgi:hypothetical protein